MHLGKRPVHDDIRQFVLALLQKKARLPAGFDDFTDFVTAGIVDSIGIIKFVLQLESRFEIEILDSDIESPAFRTVRGLVEMIGRKAAD
jgi:D-alanine--poly(phosphoribitol) ligase subunit 2